MYNNISLKSGTNETRFNNCFQNFKFIVKFNYIYIKFAIVLNQTHIMISYVHKNTICNHDNIIFLQLLLIKYIMTKLNAYSK